MVRSRLPRPPLAPLVATTRSPCPSSSRDRCPLAATARFYQEGASWIFPDVWEEYLAPIPEVRNRVWRAHDTSGRVAIDKLWSICVGYGLVWGLAGRQVERGDLMSAYYRRLTGADEQVRNKAAAAWTKWECSTSRLLVDADMVKKASDDAWAYAFARIEWYTPIPVRVILSASER